MVDLDLLIVEEQNAVQDTIVVHMVLDITLELAQDQDPMGLDQTMDFWLEYWVDDPKLVMMIL